MCGHSNRGHKTINSIKTFAKKTIWVCLSLFMVHLILSNNLNAENDISVPIVTLDIPAVKPKKSIGIIQIVEHESLDQAQQGVIDALRQNGYKKDVNLDIAYQIAYGNSVTASQIIQQFIDHNPNAIVAIGTPAAQAAMKACQVANIPVVFSSVTDAEAAGLIHNQMTGSLDFPRLNDNLTLIKQFVPAIKKLGVIYAAAEQNSVAVITDLRKLVKPLAIELVEINVTDSAQVSNAINGLIGKVDAVYLPSDSTVFSAINIIVKTSRQHNMPVFSSDPDSIRCGILAGIGYDQKNVGYLAGELTAEILDGVKVKDLLERAPVNSQLYINDNTFNALNKVLKFDLPEKITKSAIFTKK